MDLARTSEVDSHKWLAGLGPEPLGNAFSEDHLVARLKGRKMPIKSALLDQKIVAGMGNIYVCETLYRAGIHPARQAGAISERRVRTLVPIIRQVLEEAIAAGGSSLRDFRQADGELGYFQHNFDVYGREGMTCKTQECQAEVRRIVQSGRSSFYCPTCQR
jgi:formamidopyrimidine-DNA glycosylase